MTDYTAEELRLCADAKDAHANGGTVEQRNPDTNYGDNKNWHPLIGPLVIGAGWRYRPKPQPKTRKWNRGADVPSPCWLKFANESWGETLVIAVRPTGVVVAGLDGETHLMLWEDLACVTTTHSTTRLPDSWHPCEVTEGEG